MMIYTTPCPLAPPIQFLSSSFSLVSLFPGFFRCSFRLWVVGWRRPSVRASSVRPSVVRSFVSHPSSVAVRRLGLYKHFDTPWGCYLLQLPKCPGSACAAEPLLVLEFKKHFDTPWGRYLI